MTVILRTHGGLGNQLFQIFFARLFARANELPYVEIHDANYQHKFARSAEIAKSSVPISASQLRISRLRIPKILSKSGLHKTEKFYFLGDVYLDGYFQKAENFLEFSDDMIMDQVSTLRSELRITAQTSLNSQTLYHIRLGDFFDHPKKAQEHAISRVKQLQANSTIITNQEDVFADDLVKQHLRLNGCVLQSTKDYSSEDVIRLMSTYGHVVTNNSTLALWASILGNCRISLNDPRLSAVHRRLFDLANPFS